MLWASFVGMPFGVLDFFLVPQYWHPGSLFGLMEKFGMGIESFLFMFLMSGMCSVIYEYVFKKRLRKIHKKGTHIIAVALPLALFFIFAAIFREMAIYIFILAGLLGTLFILFARRDLLPQALFSGILFAVFYGFAFFLVIKMFPGLITSVYNLENIIGIFIFGIPVEEILAAVFVGAFWSMAFEYVKNYRIA